MSWKSPNGIIGIPFLIIPAILESLGKLSWLIGFLVIFVLDFTINSIISALVPCKLATDDTFPFLTNLKILSAADLNDAAKKIVEAIK